MIYFKHRRRFDFHPHKYDIGILLGVQQGYEDNHFLLKIYKLPEDEYPLYYDYHLKYFTQEISGTDQEFFAHVWHIVTNRILYYERQDPHTTKHASHVSSIRKLTAFKNYLATMDQWKIHFPLESVLIGKDREIELLTARIASLEAQLEKLTPFESAEKVTIPDGKLGTAIDLFRQLQELTLPNSKKLFRSQTQSPWYKMLSKYFNHGESSIPINTSRNYFAAQKKGTLIKGSDVQEKEKLFQITARSLD